MLSIKDIIYTTNIVEVTADDLLSKALAKLPSSHAAAFILSKDKKTVGLVNPYHCVIKSSLPGNAKVNACIFHAPRLYINSSFEKVIHAFISSKVHYLPVFQEDETFAGVVSTRRVLNVYKNSPLFHISIDTYLKLKVKPLVTIDEHDSIANALHLFKMHKVSKLILINKDNKLKGVLSYYDIVHLLVSPRHKLHSGGKESKKDSIYHQTVSKYAKSFVLTLKKNETIRQALMLVLDKKIGSVIVVDENKHPVGILTTRDFFSLILKPPMGLQFQIMRKQISHTSSEFFQSFFKPFQTPSH